MLDFFDLLKYKKEVKELNNKLSEINLTIEQTKYLDLNKEISKLEMIKKVKQSEVDILISYIKDLTQQAEELQNEIQIRTLDLSNTKNE